MASFGCDRPECQDSEPHVHVRLEIEVASLRLSWRDAVKLRFAGRQAREHLLDEIRLRMTHHVMDQDDPETRTR